MAFFDGTVGEEVVKPNIFLEPLAENAQKIVMCDGSAYDDTKPHLLITLGNHTVEALPKQTKEFGFDATCGRMFSSISMHDRCGVIVASARHASALKVLGYPVVEWGQTVAFPLCPKAIKKMGLGTYAGAVVVHTFTEPAKCHDTFDKATGAITGSDMYDGANHLAGAYITAALAIEAATRGSTLINAQTMHSGTELQKQEVQIVVALNTKSVTSVTFEDTTGGSSAPDGKKIMCVDAVADTHPLVISRKQIRPGFDKMIQEISGSAASFSTALDVQVSSMIGGGIFQQYDKRLEADIRDFATERTQVGTKSFSVDKCAVVNTTQKIEMCDLSANLQQRYVTTAMVAMKQPMCIGAPTIVISKSDTDGKMKLDENAPKEESLYGNKFTTTSYTLGAAQSLVPGETVHPYFGVVAVQHALFLNQISSQQAYDICAPFAKRDSPFLDCADASCECNAHARTSINKPSGTPISSRFESMMQGVSQNIALSTNINIGKDPAGILKATGFNPKIDISKQDECKAATKFGVTCKCMQCVSHSKLLNLASLVANATHSYQKCDNYVSDQTMCAVNVNGVPQYKSTESMMPFGTAMKAMMMKCGPSEDSPIKVRLGMNTDDCENCAFQSKAIFDTLTLGSQAISREFFHKPNVASDSVIAVGSKVTSGEVLNNLNTSSVYNPDVDNEKIRSMHLANLAKDEQRHILLTCEVLGENIIPQLAYFVTGSATKANDVKSTNSNMSSNLHPGMVVDLSSPVGTGLNAFGSKPLGFRIGKEEEKEPKKAAEENTGLSGHCTCTLSIARKDGFQQTIITEGTAPLILAPCGISSQVNHRGSLTGKIDDNTKVLGASGTYKGTIDVENAVDVSLTGMPSSHVATISNRFQVDGSSMRAREIMGYKTDIAGNCENFYKEVVSVASLQVVTADGKGGIQPGADVRSFLTQGVHPTITAAIAACGEKEIAKAMGGAKHALVPAFDETTEDYKKFMQTHASFARAMSPLRVSLQTQATEMLTSMGSLSSLSVNFPDDKKLMKSHGPLFFIGNVTHVPLEDSTKAHRKVMKSLENHAKHMNSEYVNVRVAPSVVVGSGEIVTLYKIYGTTDGF